MFLNIELKYLQHFTANSNSKLTWSLPDYPNNEYSLYTGTSHFTTYVLNDHSNLRPIDFHYAIRWISFVVVDIVELVDYGGIYGELTSENLIKLELLQHLGEEKERTEEVKKQFTVYGLVGMYSKINEQCLKLRLWIEILNNLIMLNVGWVNF